VVAVNLPLANTFANISARISAFARQGGLHIVFITVDGEDAAFELCVIHGNKCCDLTTAYCKKYVSCGVESLEQMEINRVQLGYDR